MSLPKTLSICGYEWKVVYDPKTEGAEGVFKTRTITIGTKCAATKENLLHEILEIILVEKLHCYWNDDKGGQLFSFDHHQFCGIVKDLLAALKDSKIFSP